MKRNGIAIIAFTENGSKLAERIRNSLSEKVFSCEKKIQARDFVCEYFKTAEAIIFIGACGICVRMIATLIETKDADPAVLVIDEKGRFVISVLSGHLGGANALAVKISKILDAQPVITTATDINGKFAVDIWTKNNGCRISDLSKIKYISGAILRGDGIGFLCDDFPVSGTLPFKLDSNKPECGICVGLSADPSPWIKTMNVIPQIITIGIGCRRGVDPDKLSEFVKSELQANGISPLSVEAIASIDIKRDEPAIIKLSEEYDVPLVTYTPEELMSTTGDFSHSDMVEKTTGADNVCERACVRQSDGKLILKKTAKDGMTLAAAVRDWRCEF